MKVLKENKDDIRKKKTRDVVRPGMRDRTG